MSRRLTDGKTFTTRFQDGMPKEFLLIMSCGHKTVLMLPPIQAVGLKGTFGFCNKHGKMTVKDVFPADKVTGWRSQN